MDQELLEETLKAIHPLPAERLAAARAELAARLTAPGALGRLAGLAAQLMAGLDLALADGGLARRLPLRKTILLMFADHGVAAEGVSAWPPGRSTELARRILDGAAEVNALARAAGARLVVTDCGLARPPTGSATATLAVRLRAVPVGPGTANIARGPAMSRAEALRALAVGIEAVEEELLDDEELALVGLGGVGAGGTTAATALAVVLTQQAVRRLVGRGSGLDDAGLERKSAAIRRALEVNEPPADDPLDLLARLGGFELGALAGAILAVAAAGRLAVLDGLAATAAAALAAQLAPDVRSRLIVARRSAEPAQAALLELLDLAPVLDLDLGPATGAGVALALLLIDAAGRVAADLPAPKAPGTGSAGGKARRP